MATKPTTLASILGPKPDHLRETGRDTFVSNRFASLRDRSRSLSVGQAVKRRSEDPGEPDGKVPRYDRNAKFAQMTKVEGMVKQGKEKVVKIKSDLGKADVSQEVRELLSAMTDFMGLIVDTVEDLASAIVDHTPTNGQRLEQAGRQEETGKVKNTEQQGGNTSQDPSDQKKRKFIQAVKEAEKSVLVFNLDMGKVPIMNKTTLSANVTKDITLKAAKIDGNANGRPKEDTVVILEDTLSMMKGMEFFGKVTKPNKAKSVEESGKFHTMPVNMIFKERDSRNRAEQVLRKHCGLQCTVPYPQRLRLMMKKVMEEQKETHKDSFIQVRVDTESMALKVSKRTNNTWENNIATIPIPESVLDLGRTGNTPTGPVAMEGAEGPL